MKKRISATIDEKTEKMLSSLLKIGDFRNKSHIIEKAIRKLWKDANEKE
jgi:Arc/MetJ-type ribon-helix-helix transcriptional regulator